MLGLGVYNYAYYLLGAALNAFSHCTCACVLSSITLILVLSRADVEDVAAGFNPQTPVRLVGVSRVRRRGLELRLAHHVGGLRLRRTATPVEPEAFELVAALDLSMMVTALVGGGVLLWRRQAWGYVITTIAGIQGALYLMVLSVNSLVAIRRGFAETPGELPVSVRSPPSPQSPRPCSCHTPQARLGRDELRPPNDFLAD